MEPQLPQRFLERMRQLLEDAYPAFAASYEHPSWHGLRVNPLKVTRERFAGISPFALRPVAWCPDGFTYPESERPGKHPYHAAGLYYIQEPSAMAVAAALDAKPGDTVLDLCAAPGGKTTQIAAAMRGEGLLVANEIHPQRAKALSENIERLGIVNAIVTNETPERLAERFPAFFDRILVDAPCSGEGMFRKLPEAINDWSEAKVAECHAIQGDILSAAARMLKPGGTLVYSTCTFAPLENEQTVADFLAAHPHFALVPVPNADRFAPGRPDWAQGGDARLVQTVRLWPHLLEGEGHFIAAFIKQELDCEKGDNHHSPPRADKQTRQSSSLSAAAKRELLQAWHAFAEDAAPGVLDRTADTGAYRLFGEQVYYLPVPDLDLGGLKIVRAGWHLGTLKKNRLEPSHALALAMRADDAARLADYPADDPDLLRYLRGESLSRTGANGWTLVTVDGYPLGWGKQVDGQLKNHYPKGLRWM